MADAAALVCRARFMLPLAGPDRARRIQDGYVLASGDRVLEAGPYTPETGSRLLRTWGDRLQVLHTRREMPSSDPIPMQDMVLLPGLVKAHGHDHKIWRHTADGQVPPRLRSGVTSGYHRALRKTGGWESRQKALLHAHLRWEIAPVEPRSSMLRGCVSPFYVGARRWEVRISRRGFGDERFPRLDRAGNKGWIVVRRIS